MGPLPFNVGGVGCILGQRSYILVERLLAGWELRVTEQCVILLANLDDLCDLVLDGVLFDLLPHRHLALGVALVLAAGRHSILVVVLLVLLMGVLLLVLVLHLLLHEHLLLHLFFLAELLLVLLELILLVFLALELVLLSFELLILALLGVAAFLLQLLLVHLLKYILLFLSA